jgi:2-hydroxychromene-2-carboxylate isomerase
MYDKIDLWFTCGSTYTTLTLLRLADVEARTGASFNLRPFYLADILTELGSWPFPEGSPKTRYMWRDVERRATFLGLSPNVPLPYPAPKSALANQVAHVALKQAWGRRFLAEMARAWLEDGLMPGSDESLAHCLPEVGQDVDVVLREVERLGAHKALIAETAEARRSGLFGSPICVANGELFWGDDRIEDAIGWADNYSS